MYSLLAEVECTDRFIDLSKKSKIKEQKFISDVIFRHTRDCSVVVFIDRFIVVEPKKGRYLPHFMMSREISKGYWLTYIDLIQNMRIFECFDDYNTRSQEYIRLCDMKECKEVHLI